MPPAIIHLSGISSESVHELINDYPNIVPPKLLDLDQSRYDTVPSLLAERSSDNDAHLTLSELSTLVDWKLSHGTFRPSLKALVTSNANDTVEASTRRAFSTLDPASTDSVRKSLGELTKLKGIGPATASLALSVCDPEHIPFFSDEYFRWALWEDSKGKGWDRPIKYTLKEYMELFEKVQKALHRMKKDVDIVKAVDLEKVAYVLAKRKAGRDDGGVDNAAPKTVAKAASDAVEQKQNGTGSKRKAERTDQGGGIQTTVKKSKVSVGKTSSVRPEGTRSSARLRNSVK